MNTRVELFPLNNGLILISASNPPSKLLPKMTSKNSTRKIVYDMLNKWATLRLTASIYSVGFCCLSLDFWVTLVVFEAISKQAVKISKINSRLQINQDPYAKMENISFFFEELEFFIKIIILLHHAGNHSGCLLMFWFC